MRPRSGRLSIHDGVGGGGGQPQPQGESAGREPADERLPERGGLPRPPRRHPGTARLTPENSRRLHALAAWFTLRAYGQDGRREITERCVGCARALGDAVESTPGLRLLAPVGLNVVCFTLADDPTVMQGRIVEYWIQIDRQQITAQLQRAATEH
ncbi:hypothetical protein [Streptomyces sp. NBC_00887]|uniref:hypothetical protein n=1 Tax=Streptomyces sp. NBC_00887 TaxID=2975859 RepID=UPI0038680DB0